MWADTLGELHEMAQSIGLKREWYQEHPRLPHYDVSRGLRDLALRNGAVKKSVRDAFREKHMKERRNAQVSKEASGD